MRNLLKLFLTFFKIGLFTFGGGHAMVAIVEQEFVDRQKDMSEEEFVDMIAIAESTPGPIAINMATFIGNKKAGFLGSLFATLGVILPSFIIIFIVSLFLQNLLEYELVKKAFKGISCAVAVIILFHGIKLFKIFRKHWFYIVFFALTFAVMLLSEIGVIKFSYLTIVLILSAGVLGILFLKNLPPKKHVEVLKKVEEPLKTDETKKEEE